MGLADYLNRLLQEITPDDHMIANELIVCTVGMLAYNNHVKIMEESSNDDELKAVKALIRNRWCKNK